MSGVKKICSWNIFSLLLTLNSCSTCSYSQHLSSEADGEKIFSAIEDRFSVLSTEIDKKDNMIIHLMKENEDLLSRECSKVEGEELDSEEIQV